MNTIHCPQCNKLLQLRESMLGKIIRCPGCQTTFQPAPPVAVAEEIPEVLPADPPHRPVLRGEPDYGRSSLRRAPSQRKGWGAGLVVGILAGVFLLCSGVVTVAYFLGKAVVNVSRQPIPVSLWQPVQPSGGHCIVSMPGQPVPILRSDAASSHPNIQRFGVTLPEYHLSFMIAYLEISANHLASLGPNPVMSLAQTEIEGLRNQAGGTLAMQQPATAAGQPAQEFVMNLPDNQRLIERVVVVPRGQAATAYFLVVQGPELALAENDVERFFFSLHVEQEATPKPPPNPNPTPNPPPNPRPAPKPRPHPSPAPKPGPNPLTLQGDPLPTAPIGRPTRAEEAVRFSLPSRQRMIRFSPDGKTLAVARQGELVLLNTADWRRRANRTLDTPGLVFAYSKNGRLVGAGHSTGAPVNNPDTRDSPPRGRGRRPVGGTTPGTPGMPNSARVYLHNADSAALQKDFPAGSGYLRSLAVSADGNLVAGSFDSVPRRRIGQPPPNASGLIRVWDISKEPKLLGTLEKLPYPVAALDFSGDGKTLYAAAGRTVRRWQVPACTELSALKGPLGDLAALAVAGDERVYAAGQDMLIHSWDAEGRPAQPWEGHTGAVGSLALTADGKRLASVAQDRTCRLWDTATGEKTATTEAATPSYATSPPLLALSPDGTLMAVDASNGDVSVLKTALLRGKAPVANVPAKKAASEPGAVAAFAQEGTHFFVNAAFSSQQTLLTANNIGAVQLWKWPAGTLRDTCQQPSSAQTLARSRDGKLVAIAAGNSVYLRDSDTGKLRATVVPEDIDKHPFAQLVHIALAPDGDLLAMALSLGKDHEVIIWDVKQGRRRSLIHTPDSLTSLDFSPDGKTLAAGGFVQRCVILYDSSDLKELRRVARQPRGVKAVAFSPDGKKLATSSDAGPVMMWDLAKDKELWSKPWSQANAWKQSICFSPDGKWLVSAPLSRKYGLVLVDAADGSLRAHVTRYPMPNSNPSFSPDGKLLAVVHKAPGQVVVYDVEKLVAARH